MTMQNFKTMMTAIALLISTAFSYQSIAQEVSLVSYAKQQIETVVSEKKLTPKYKPEVYLGVMLQASQINPKYVESQNQQLALTSGVGLFGLTVTGVKKTLSVNVTRDQLLNPFVNIELGVKMIDSVKPVNEKSIQYNHIGSNQIDDITKMLYAFYGMKQFTKVTQARQAIKDVKVFLTIVKIKAEKTK